MIKPEDATIIDPRESFTIEEAVAKMLGWMHGPIRLQTIQMDDRGILPDQLPHLHSLFISLDDILDQLRERARLEMLDAADAYEAAGRPEEGAVLEAVWEKEDAVTQCTELIISANFYKSEINKELAKGESSALKIDQPETDKTGVDHIRLHSLDAWAKQYGVSIIDAPESLPANTPKPQDSQQKMRRFDALAVELDEILSEVPTLTLSQVMAKLRALAGKPNCCILEILDEGIKWQRDDGVMKITSSHTLEERIRHWKEKHRLSQG